MSDAQELSMVSRETFYDTFTGTCAPEDMEAFLDAHFNLEQVKGELSNKEDFFYLAEMPSGIAGYTRYMEDYKNFPMMKEWKALELKRLYVKKEFKGKGVAQLLMDHVLQYATENNYEVVWLGVWEHNRRATRFYEKCGFVKSGYMHDFPIGKSPQIDHWMWKFLDRTPA